MALPPDERRDRAKVNEAVAEAERAKADSSDDVRWAVVRQRRLSTSFRFRARCIATSKTNILAARIWQGAPHRPL
jgi:very-short-patch-repair endonuclease